MDGEGSPLGEADARDQAVSASQVVLQGWLMKRERLLRAVAGRAPLTLANYPSKDAVQAEILGVDAAILHTLARQTDDGKLSEFYKDLAGFLDDLRRLPIPSFVKRGLRPA